MVSVVRAHAPCWCASSIWMSKWQAGRHPGLEILEPRNADAEGALDAKQGGAHQCQKPTLPGVNTPFSSKSFP